MALDSESVDWVKKANRLWIVREGMDLRSEKYLDSLPDSVLKMLCVRVRGCTLLGMMRYPNPKTFFYPALYSLVDLEDLPNYLMNHWFTYACLVYHHRGEMLLDPEGVEVGLSTRQLIPKVSSAIDVGAEVFFRMRRLGILT